MAILRRLLLPCDFCWPECHCVLPGVCFVQVQLFQARTPGNLRRHKYICSLPCQVSNKALHDRHWEQILSLVQNQSYNPDKPLNASDLIE
eukprot:scaffold213594_cov18-Tisochrysis_lutea.AAC.1